MVLRAALLLSVFVAGLWSSFGCQPDAPHRITLSGADNNAGVSMLLPSGWQPHRLMRDQEPVRYLISCHEPAQPYIMVEFRENSVQAEHVRRLLSGGAEGELHWDRERRLTWGRETLARDRRVTVFVTQPAPLMLQFVAPREYVHGFEDSIVAIVDSMQTAEQPLSAAAQPEVVATSASEPVTASGLVTASGAMTAGAVKGRPTKGDDDGLEFRFPTENPLAGLGGSAWVVLGLCVLSGAEWLLRSREHRRRVQEADHARDMRGELWQPTHRTPGAFDTEA